MKYIFNFSLVFLLSANLMAQPVFSVFLDSVQNINDSTSRVTYIESYIAHLDAAGAPTIESNTANFIYYGKADTVELAGDFNAWGGNGVWICNRIENTNFFYYSQIFETTARLDYKFIVNKSNWILDPLNPNTCSGGYGPNSELAMSGYVQPWEIEEYEEVPKGTTEQFNLECTALNKTFRTNVYLPPSYDETLTYATAYVHDGSEYMSLGSMTNILDNLIDSNKIDPIIAVFITPNNRMDEYGGTEREEFATFIAETVVPYIDANYKTIKSKDYRLTMGCSLGGNISGLISFNYPNIFALSGWHSPALWVNEQEVAELYKSEHKDIKVYFNQGSYENLEVDWNIFTTQLGSLGYEYDWKTLHEGHSWGQWRATTDDILQFFFPKGTTPINVNYVNANNFALGQNFPNPCKKNTSIPLSINNAGSYNLEVYNVLGQSHIQKALKYNDRGEFNIKLNTADLPNGIYYYVLRHNQFSLTQRMVVE